MGSHSITFPKATGRGQLADNLLRVLLGLSFLCCIGLSVAGVRRVVESSKKPASALFDHGLTAVVTHAPVTWSNEFCGQCHKSEYEQWKQSKHAVSGSNASFQLEFLMPQHGRTQFCLNCHAPLNPYATNFPTDRPAGLDEAFASGQEWIVRGVDCLTCHVREGAVLATKVTPKGQKAHPMRLTPELGTAEFCAGCHQFAFKETDSPDGFRGELQQASFEEFLDVRARGEGESRCHDCHLPDGDHRMPGGYDAEMLQQAVDLDLSARWRDDLQGVLVSVVVEGGHVGHRIPGGENFRFLSLQTKVTDDDGKLLTPRLGNADAITKAREQFLNDTDTDVKIVDALPQIERMQRLLKPHPDTRLWPGEQRRFEYLIPLDRKTIDGPLSIRAEIWYHLMGEAKALKLGHAPHKVSWMVTRKETTLRLKALR